MLSKAEIVERINLAWEAVEESRVGQKAGGVASQMGFPTFMHVLEALLPKFVKHEAGPPPLEDWQR